MLLPFNANKIEQLVLDPEKIIDGYIWFNSTEKLFKTYINGVVNVFITDLAFVNDIQPLIDIAVAFHEYTITFTNVTRIIVKHNKGKKQNTYTIFDDIEHCILNCTITIIDDNEFHIDLVDHATGRIYMYFE